MDANMTSFYETCQFPSFSYLAFKTGTYRYELVYPSHLSNGTTDFICRKLNKVTVDFSEPNIWRSDFQQYDVATLSGLTNPMLTYRVQLGYDFATDQILLALGEWDLASAYFDCTTVKLLGIERDFSAGSVLQANLLALAQTAVAAIDEIKYYAHFYGYGGNIVGALGCYDGATEENIIAKYNGAAWSAAHQAVLGINEHVEPIWSSADVFYGWLTEGHGMDSYFVKADLSSIVACRPPQGTFTSEPTFDMVNHKVVWGEWGYAGDTTQYVYVADPHATTGCANFVNSTPSGNLVDNEGNTMSLSTCWKANGTVYGDREGNSWMVHQFVKGSATARTRTTKVTLNDYSTAASWGFLENCSGSDLIMSCGVSRCINPTTLLFEPVPLITTYPLTS